MDAPLCSARPCGYQVNAHPFSFCALNFQSFVLLANHEEKRRIAGSGLLTLMSVTDTGHSFILPRLAGWRGCPTRPSHALESCIFLCSMWLANAPEPLFGVGGPASCSSVFAWSGGFMPPFLQWHRHTCLRSSVRAGPPASFFCFFLLCVSSAPSAVKISFFLPRRAVTDEQMDCAICGTENAPATSAPRRGTPSPPCGSRADG